jgi:hypothetical protein
MKYQLIKPQRINSIMILKKFSARFRNILLISFIFLFPGTIHKLNAQTISRDLNVSLLVNQVGYLPEAEKFCITKGDVRRDFEVIDLKTLEVVYKGVLQPNKGDFGTYLKGVFSPLSDEGHYYIKSATLRSFPFEISNSIYQNPMDLIVYYFSRQRCGPSTTGYLAPCHVDDGIRLDNGKHQNVSGGWHDASDLRKWVGATIYGMISLAKTYELRKGHNGRRILDELMWGNRYFLNMQEPQGYIMSFIGGDVKKHSDSNRWTDNEVGEEGGEVDFVKPTAGKSQNDMLIFGSNDDRVIRTDPLNMTGQFNFITSEALMARITRDKDNVYSLKCLKAAINCFNWCTQTDRNTNPGTIGAGIQASIELYKTTNDVKYKDYAIEKVAKLKKLQAPINEDNFGGFFFNSPTGKQPYKNISRGCLEFISLCDLIQTFPAHKDVSNWKDMISDYAYHYLRFISNKNNFGIVPFGLYTDEDPGGNRKEGKYWYRYFMQPELSWWVGINANITSAGVGLVKAARILNDQELAGLAQRQLDWVVGVNPFNSSTMVGVGHNHLKHFAGSSFLPRTPVIPGAVQNGMGGDHEDQPIIGDGWWQISEYWTPMVAYTLWLMAEISNADMLKQP